MRLMTLFVLALSLAAAQTARVVEINATDAAILESAAGSKRHYAELYDREVKRIERKYLTVEDTDPERGHTQYYESTNLTGGTGNLVTSGSIAWATGTDTITGATGVVTVDPCYRSWESVACLEKRLAEAKVKEAEGKKPTPTPHYRWYRRGFEGGGVFTDDYRFFVPKPALIYLPPPYDRIPCWGGSCLTLTPNSWSTAP